jgi:hypothetical protein
MPNETSDLLVERLKEVERGYVLEVSGCYFTRDVTVNEWRDCGREIRNRAVAAQWQLGDWLLEGGRQRDRRALRVQDVEGRWFQHSVYEEAARVTGYSESHLSNCARVAEAFPRDQRVLTLTFSHHREVLKLPPGDERAATLALCVERRWGVEDLINYIASVHAEPEPVPSKRPNGYMCTHVKCPHCQYVFPVRGHKVPRPRPEG